MDGNPVIPNQFNYSAILMHYSQFAKQKVLNQSSFTIPYILRANGTNSISAVAAADHRAVTVRIEVEVPRAVRVVRAKRT